MQESVQMACCDASVALTVLAHVCRSVSTRQLEGLDLCRGPMVAALASLSVEVHAGVVNAADQFFQELRRRYARTL